MGGVASNVNNPMSKVTNFDLRNKDLSMSGQCFSVRHYVRWTRKLVVYVQLLLAVLCDVRLVAKAVCRRVKQKVVEMLSPIQLGFGIELGAEAAVHAATKYLEVLGRGQGPLKLDFSNAFNSISRDILIHVVASELFKFVKNCYAEQSNLYFGSHIILSAEGVQQGDILSQGDIL